MSNKGEQEMKKLAGNMLKPNSHFIVLNLVEQQRESEPSENELNYYEKGASDTAFEMQNSRPAQPQAVTQGDKIDWQGMLNENQEGYLLLSGRSNGSAFAQALASRPVDTVTQGEGTRSVKEPGDYTMNDLRERIMDKFVACEPDAQGATFIVDGQWYAPMYGCDTLDIVLDSLHSVEGDDHEFDQPSKDPTITRMRVPSGWIYYAWCLKTDSLVLDSGVFVPFTTTKQEGEG